MVNNLKSNSLTTPSIQSYLIFAIDWENKDTTVLVFEAVNKYIALEGFRELANLIKEQENIEWQFAGMVLTSTTPKLSEIYSPVDFGNFVEGENNVH